MTAASGTATHALCSHAAQAMTPSAVTGRVWSAASAASLPRARTRTAPSIRSITSATPTAAKALDTAAASVAASQVSCGAAAVPAADGATASKTATATETSAAARARLNTSFSGRRYWRRSTPNPTRAPATLVRTSVAGTSDISARNSGTSLRKTERASRRSCTLTTRAWVATKIPSRTTAGTGRPGGAA